MRIIITGGTGLIGRPLTASLVQDGHEVIVLSRQPQQASAKVPGAQVVAWDARSPEGWGQLADGADAIVNLAGEGLAEGRWSDSRKKRILDSRVNAGKAVLQAIEAAERKPGVLIQASAVGYYGTRENEVIDADAQAGNDFLAQVCVDWEEATKPAQAMGVRWVAIRTGLVLSSEGGALPRLLLPFRLFAGGKLGSGQQYWPWIHIADEVAAIRFLMETPEAAGPFNVSAPNPVTNSQFSKTLGNVMGKPSVVPAPSFALKLFLGEQSTVVLDGQRAVPKRLLELGFTFRFPTLEAALRDLVG